MRGAPTLPRSALRLPGSLAISIDQAWAELGRCWSEVWAELGRAWPGVLAAAERGQTCADHGRSWGRASAPRLAPRQRRELDRSWANTGQHWPDAGQNCAKAGGGATRLRVVWNAHGASSRTLGGRLLTPSGS